MSGAFEGSKRRAEGHRLQGAKRSRNGEANERARGRPAGAAGTRPVGEGAGAKRPGRPKSPNPPQETLNHHYSARREAQGSHGRMGFGGDARRRGGGRQADECERLLREGCKG